MSDKVNETADDGGDISSGFGDPKVDGPVSDEKAEQMLHGGDVVESADVDHDSVFAVDSAGVVDVEGDEGDEAGKQRPDAAGGGGGGGW